MNRSWYTDTADKKSPDTVHQILAFGTLEDIRSLKKAVGEAKIRELFINYPKKVYSRSLLEFVKKFILHIRNQVDEEKYLKYTPRSTR
jgi:negative regulator of genetic competence, sporulation and motility